MSRLKVYEDTARFQLVAEEAVRGHAEGTETPLRHIHLACTQAGTALARLAQALLSCPAEAQPARPSIVTAFSPGGGSFSLQHCPSGILLAILTQPHRNILISAYMPGTEIPLRNVDLWLLN